MTFDPNADPDAVISRATELALEQTERLNSRIKNYENQGYKVDHSDFYKDPFEISISNKIALLLCGAHFAAGCDHGNCKNSPINPKNK